MIHTAHRFADADALVAALAEAEPIALDVIGAAHDAEGEPVEGWHANAAWGGEMPEGWAARRIAPEDAPRWWAGVPLAPPDTGPPTVAELVAAVDDLVESTARGMDYKSAAHCAGYVTSTIPQWAAESAAFVAWRDVVWMTVYSLDPANPPPTIAAALALLPEFERPGT
jgi:hypothetical protein